MRSENHTRLPSGPLACRQKAPQRRVILDLERGWPHSAWGELARGRRSVASPGGPALVLLAVPGLGR